MCVCGDVREITKILQIVLFLLPLLLLLLLILLLLLLVPGQGKTRIFTYPSVDDEGNVNPASVPSDDEQKLYEYLESKGSPVFAPQFRGVFNDACRGLKTVKGLGCLGFQDMPTVMVLG